MKFAKEWLIALAVLIAAGVLTRSLSHGEAVPIRKSFAEFPLQLTQWHGTALELDDQVLQILRVDDYMMRQYRDQQGASLGLYVGYYASQRQGATYHSPKNCLPGSGWAFIETGTASLPVASQEERPIEINKFIIQKGLEKQLVLYWYQDRGRILTSEYWAKIYMILDAMTKNRTDGAFIRVTVPFTSNDEVMALRRGIAFATDIFPLLQAYLPDEGQGKDKAGIN